MTAREYLRQIEILRIKIQQRRQQAAELREKALSLGSPSLKADPVQTSKSGSMVEKQVVQYLDMERRAEQLAVRMEKMRDKIIGEIQELDNPNYIEILYKKYVRLMTFKEIAKDTGKNHDWLRHLIRKAEWAFEKKYQISEKTAQKSTRSADII